MTQTAPPAHARRTSSTSSKPWLSPTLWLALVAAAYAFVQMLFTPLDTFISWDEAIYSSQFSGSAITVPMSPHRAPGTAVIVAPVVALTHDFSIVRAYLAVLYVLGLFLAFRVWFKVDARSAPIAAFLFATSQVALTQAHLALPNLPTGLALVAGVGFYVRAARGNGSWVDYVGMVTMFGIASVARPTDAVFAAVPLVAAAVVIRPWRRLWPSVAVFGGLGIGFLAWLITSWVRFGGPVARFEEMRKTVDAGGEPTYVQMLDDLARTAEVATTWSLTVAAVVFAAFVVAVYLIRTVCKGWPAPQWVLTVACVFMLTVPYWVLLSFGSNRYFLPATAFGCLTVAAAIRGLLWHLRGKSLVAGAVVIVLGVAAYSANELNNARIGIGGDVATRMARATYVERLEDNGIKKPCVVSGYQAPAYAYTMGCTTGDNISALPNNNNWKFEFQRDIKTAKEQDATFVTITYGKLPPWVEGWRHVKLGENNPLYANFPPDQPK